MEDLVECEGPEATTATGWHRSSVLAGVEAPNFWESNGGDPEMVEIRTPPQARSPGVLRSAQQSFSSFGQEFGREISNEGKAVLAQANTVSSAFSSLGQEALREGEAAIAQANELATLRKMQSLGLAIQGLDGTAPSIQSFRNGTMGLKRQGQEMGDPGRVASPAIPFGVVPATLSLRDLPSMTRPQ